MRAVAFGFISAFVPAACLARMTPEAEVDPSMHAWFEAQHSISGAWCCDVSDGHMLADSEWRVIGEKYEVRINGKWIEILPGQLRDPSGGFNPTGQAVVWYVSGEWGVRIYCFAPGQFY